jgi:hypothetical protein
VSIRTIANETGLDSKQVQKVFGELKNVLYDLDTHCVFIVNFLQYNGSGRPENIAKSILKDCEATRKTPFWYEFAERYPHWRKDKIGYDLGSAVKRILESGDSSISNSIPNSSSISKEGLPNGSTTVQQPLSKHTKQKRNSDTSKKDRRCHKCNKVFEPKSDSHYLCINCYKEKDSRQAGYVGCNNPKCSMEGPQGTMQLDQNGICYYCRECSTEPYYKQQTDRLSGG